jgi:hypothetical protein
MGIDIKALRAALAARAAEDKAARAAAAAEAEGANGVRGMVWKFTGLFNKKDQNAASSEAVKSAASAAPPSAAEATPSRSVTERITGLFKKNPVAPPGPAEAADAPATADAPADTAVVTADADATASTHPAVVAMLVGPTSATSDPPSAASDPPSAASDPSGVSSGEALGKAGEATREALGKAGAAAREGFGKAWTAAREGFGKAGAAAREGFGKSKAGPKKGSGFAQVLAPLFAALKFMELIMSYIPPPVLLAWIIQATIMRSIILLQFRDTFVDKSKKSVPEKGDFMFAGVYTAQAVLCVVFLIAFFLFVGTPLSKLPYLEIFGLLVSCGGVWASVLMDSILRSTTDTEAFRTSEVHDPAATQRRLVYLHGVSGFAVAMLVVAIPLTCPFALSFGKPLKKV